MVLGPVSGTQELNTETADWTFWPTRRSASPGDLDEDGQDEILLMASHLDALGIARLGGVK